MSLPYTPVILIKRNYSYYSDKLIDFVDNFMSYDPYYLFAVIKSSNIEEVNNLSFKLYNKFLHEEEKDSILYIINSLSENPISHFACIANQFSKKIKRDRSEATQDIMFIDFNIYNNTEIPNYEKVDKCAILNNGVYIYNMDWINTSNVKSRKIFGSGDEL